ncbi:MAG: hypothetical protein Q7R95_03645, partial [bacterium]|nr:hypothetical protein [bacterium]
YSYLSFRLTAIPLIIAMIALIAFNHMSFPRFTGMTILFSVILIITLPLNIYSFQHPDQVWARTNTISIFNQKFSPTEFRKELMANIARTYGTFINVPDPNPRQNPANTTPFDNITVLLIFTSLIIVFKKNKSFFIFIISLIFISLLGDILSIEKIPEFHYYGLGHPNTLRISSIIPIMYICIAIIFHYVFNKLPNKILGLSLLTCIAFIISAVHLNRYFNQPYLPYNYQVNGVKMLQLSEIINKTNVNHLILSSTILEDPRIQYFSQDKIKNAKIISNNTINDYKNNSSTMIIIDAPQNKELAQTFFTQGPQNGFQTYILKNPWNYPEAVILEKK